MELVKIKSKESYIKGTKVQDSDGNVFKVLNCERIYLFNTLRYGLTLKKINGKVKKQ